MPLAVPTAIVNGPATPARRCRSRLTVWNPPTTPQLARNLSPIARIRLSAANFTLGHQVLSVFARELTLSMVHVERVVPVRGAEVPASRQRLRPVQTALCMVRAIILPGASSHSKLRRIAIDVHRGQVRSR